MDISAELSPATRRFKPTCVAAHLHKSLSKQAINAAALTELDAAIARESEGQQILLGSHDFVEGTTAFQQRRKPTFTDG